MKERGAKLLIQGPWRDFKGPKKSGLDLPGKRLEMGSLGQGGEKKKKTKEDLWCSFSSFSALTKL